MDSKKPRHSVASKVAIIASALAFVCLVGVVSLNFIAKPISADTYVKPFDSSPQTAVKVDQSTTQPAVAETTNGCDKTKEVPIAINNYTDPNSPSNKQLLDTKTRLKVTSAPEFLRCTNVCVPATDASTANQDVAKWIRANRPTIASELSKWKVGGSPLNVIPNYIDIDKVATKEALAQTVVTQAIKPLCEGDSSREYATLTDAQGKSVTPFKANDGYAKYEEQLNKDREAAKAAKAKAEQEAAAAKAKASTAAPQTAAPAANPQIALAASNTVTIKMTGKAFLSEEDKINGKIPDIGIRIMAALGSSYKTALNYKCAFDVTGLKEGKYILSLTMDKTFYEVNIKPDAQDAKIYIFLWNDNWTRESYFVFDYNKRKQYGADETDNLIKIKMPELTLKDKIDGRWANFVTKTNVSSQTECKDQSNAGQVKSESKTTPSVSSANNNDLESAYGADATDQTSPENEAQVYKNVIIKGTIGSDSNASGYWCVGISGSTGCHAGTFDKHSASFSETISLGSGYTRQQMIEKELYAWVYAYSSNGWWRSEVNYANSAYFYNVPLENYSGDTITLNFSQMMLGRDNFTQNQNGLKTWTGSSLSCEDQYNNGKNTATSAKPTDGTYAAYLNYTPSFVYAKTLTVYLPYDTSNLADKNVACINSKYLDDPNNNGRLIKNSSVQPYWASFQVTPQIMSGLYQASLQQNTKILYAFIGNEKSKYSLSLYLTNNFLGYTGNNIAWQDIDSTNPKIILPKMQLIPGSYSSGGNQRSNSFASLFGYRCESVFQ